MHNKEVHVNNGDMDSNITGKAKESKDTNDDINESKCINDKEKQNNGSREEPEEKIDSCPQKELSVESDLPTAKTSESEAELRYKELRNKLVPTSSIKLLV